MISVRSVLIGIAIAFSAYYVARGLIWTHPPVSAEAMIAAVAVYVVATVVCLFVEPRVRSSWGPTPLPLPVIAVPIAASAAMPSLVAVAVGGEDLTSPHASWFIGASGVLLTIVVVRRRAWVAWLGVVAMIAVTAWHADPADALMSGGIGSAMWVGVAQLLLMLTDRAYRDTVRLARLQQASSAWYATQRVRRNQRRLRVRYALSTAGPVLSRVIAADGVLTPQEREQARLAEGRLRDELRGALLLDDAVREAIEACRRRGATVTVLDEGGVGNLDGGALAAVRGQIAEALREADAARIIVRSAPHPEIAATVVGRSADDDDVSIWLEIPRPR